MGQMGESQIGLRGLNLRGMDFDLNTLLINYSKFDRGDLLQLFELSGPYLQSGNNDATML